MEHATSISVCVDTCTDAFNLPRYVEESHYSVVLSGFEPDPCYTASRRRSFPTLASACYSIYTSARSSAGGSVDPGLGYQPARQSFPRAWRGGIDWELTHKLDADHGQLHYTDSAPSSSGHYGRREGTSWGGGLPEAAGSPPWRRWPVRRSYLRRGWLTRNFTQRTH